MGTCMAPCHGGTGLWHFSAISLFVESLAHILASTLEVTCDSDNFCIFGRHWYTMAQHYGTVCAQYCTLRQLPQFSSWKHTSAFCSVELAAIKAALPSSVYCLYFFYLYFLYCQLKLAVYTSYLLGDNGIVQRQNRPFEWYELYIIYMISFVSSELCILWNVFDILSDFR